MVRTAALVLVFLVGLGACDNSPWTWSEPKSSPDHPLQVERAGWRTVGQPEGGVWAWTVEVRNQTDTAWVGELDAAARLTGEEGVLSLGLSSQDEYASVPAGSTHRIEVSEASLRLDLVEDTRAVYTVVARIDCEKRETSSRPDTIDDLWRRIEAQVLEEKRVCEGADTLTAQ